MKSLKFLLRLAVTVVILALIVRAIDLDQAWQVLAGIRPDLLLLAMLTQFGSTFVAAYRWQLIMHNLDFGQPFAFYWRSYFKGMFLNQGLPTSIGGDAVRVLDAAGRGFRKRDALYGVAVDRISGLGALLSLAFISHFVNPELLPQQVYRPIFFLIAAALVGLLGISALRRVVWLDRYPLLALLRALATRFHKAFSRHRMALLISSAAVPLLAMLSFLCMGWALGLRYDLMTYFAIVPPALALTVIPISIAGWGVREGALVTLFALIGADKSTVLMMSLLYGLTLIAVSLPGLYVFLKGRQRPQKAHLPRQDRP